MLIRDIIEEHLEELDYLWQERVRALISPDDDLSRIQELERRLDAHLDGLAIAGKDGLLPFLKEATDGSDAGMTFAVSWALLRLGVPAALSAVIEGFQCADAKHAVGFGAALCQGLAASMRSDLLGALGAASAMTRACAAEALACHGQPDGLSGAVSLLVKDSEPEVRRTAWRAVAMMQETLAPALLQEGLRDPLPEIRREALHACAWGRKQWILEHCRQAAEQPGPENWEAIRLLAVLGRPQDLAALRAIVQLEGLGPDRFTVAGDCGHPALVDLVLAAMESPDAKTAAAAGRAYKKITGKSVDSEQHSKAAGSGDDEGFESEFAEEVTLPDASAARVHWSDARGEYTKGTRYCCGFDMTAGVNPEILGRLDMESRWQSFLRAKFAGVWPGSPADLLRFPAVRPDPDLSARAPGRV